MLTDDERVRYSRQMAMPDFGEDGQQKLKNAHVFIAGAGGLGGTISLYLAAAGIGNLRIVDRDMVELSNLNRQLLFHSQAIGSDKAYLAQQKLQQLNPCVNIEGLVDTIQEDNVNQLVTGFDVIVDALDNYPTRYLLNQAALDLNVLFIHGSVHGMDGMITTIIPQQTACLRCVFADSLPPAKTPVLGVTPGVIACLQALETIKYIIGTGELLTNRLLLFNGFDMRFTEMKLRRDPNCPDCGDK